MWFWVKFKVVFIGIIIIFILVLFSKLGYSGILEDQVKNFSLPLEKFLWQAGQKLQNFLANFGMGKVKILEQGLNTCRANFKELIFETAKLQDLKEENEALRQALELKLQESFSLILTSISSYDYNPDIIFIDKGLKDGVEKNFPVITAKKELVGQVSKVERHWSEVMLLSHTQSSFVGEVLGKPKAKGIVSGAGGKIIFREVPKEIQLEVGDIIITSSLAHSYPANLLVGQIEKVQRSDQEPFQKATIRSFFEPKDENYIFVISSF